MRQAHSTLLTSGHSCGKLRFMATTTLRAPRPANERQVKFLRSLVKQVDLTVEQHAQMYAQADAGMTSKQASFWIDTMLDMRSHDREMRRLERKAA
jgi:hypothetical protein